MSDPIIAASKTGWIAQHREKYLKDGAAGHLWDSTFAGGPGPLPTLLLTTLGARSGVESVMPLLYGKVAGGYAIIASKGGDPKHPGWYHNLRKQPECTVQVATDVFKARARTATGAERTAIWDQMAAMYPPFTAYQAKTEREIPVIVLEPVG
ncbi:MAG: nitroreductase/quinone reductase family protein [Gammaproteobacteria bacterium]